MKYIRFFLAIQVAKLYQEVGSRDWARNVKAMDFLCWFCRVLDPYDDGNPETINPAMLEVILDRTNMDTDFLIILL